MMRRVRALPVHCSCTPALALWMSAQEQHNGAEVMLVLRLFGGMQIFVNALPGAAPPLERAPAPPSPLPRVCFLNAPVARMNRSSK